jgi:hypothetical protein
MLRTVVIPKPGGSKTYLPESKRDAVDTNDSIGKGAISVKIYAGKRFCEVARVRDHFEGCGRLVIVVLAT